MVLTSQRVESGGMFEHKDKGKDNDPVDEAYLGGPHPRIILCVHYFLQIHISFVNIASCICNVKVYAIQDGALLHDHIGDVSEQI